MFFVANDVVVGGWKDLVESGCQSVGVQRQASIVVIIVETGDYFKIAETNRLQPRSMFDAMLYCNSKSAVFFRRCIVEGTTVEIRRNELSY